MIKNRGQGSGVRGQKWKKILFFLLLFTVHCSLFTVVTSCSDDPATHAYQKADELLSKGQYAKAIKAYKNIAEKYQESILGPQAQYKIGQIYHLYMNNDIEAIKSYKTLILMYPGSPEITPARKDMAEIYLRQGNYQKAISEYQWLVKNSQGREREQFHYEIAMCYLKMSDATQARIELQELLKSEPSYDIVKKILYQIASTFYIEGKFNNAINIYNEIIINYPEDELAIEAKFGKAVNLEELNNLKDALMVYKDILDKYPNKEVIKDRIRGIEARLKQAR
ncbi:MAG: tetratricopeptide repeat protein [Deltaproteobacteria bacterium]|nr:tetratricopeptide repeat protein [Deltaproteobacteria bacterium]